MISAGKGVSGAVREHFEIACIERSALWERFQEWKQQLVTNYEILRMRIYRIRNRDRLLACGQCNG